jgi:hypothetical protein
VSGAFNNTTAGTNSVKGLFDGLFNW